MFLIFFSLSCNLFGQQSKINGVVSIFNSETNTGKRKYVSNAQVEAVFGKATPTTTNKQGEFKLIYVGVNEKAPVSFSVKKTGLQVVNIDKLNAIAGQEEVIKISMASPDSIADYRRKLYLVGRTAAEKNLKNLIQEKTGQLETLKQSVNQNKTKISELSQAIFELSNQGNKIEEQAQELASKYAPINLDDASKLFKDAFLMFKKGDLDSAQMLLTKAHLAGKIDSILLEEKKISLNKKELDERDSIKNVRKNDATQALELQIDLYKTQYKFKDVIRNYELLVRLDSLNIYHLYSYAYFLEWLNQYPKSIKYYLTALKISNSFSENEQKRYDPLVASIQENLGMLYDKINDYKNAEIALNSSLKVFSELAAQDPKLYKSHLAVTENELGNFFDHIKQFKKSEDAYLAALEIRKQLEKDNPNTQQSEIAQIQNNLGNLYFNQNNYENAKIAYNSALNTYERLDGVDSQSYKKDIAMIHTNIGNLYEFEHNYSKAETSFKKAFEIYKRLSIRIPEAVEPDLAGIQINLGALYYQQGQYDKAQIFYIEVLRIYKKLAEEMPETYIPLIASIENNIGSLYRKENEFQKAEDAYIDALNITRILVKTNASVYEPELIKILNNLGNVYMVQLKYDKANQLYKEAFEIYTRLIKIDPERYEPDMAWLENNMGVLYLQKKDFKQSELMLIKALTLKKPWMERYPLIYTAAVNETCLNLLRLYYTMIDSLKYDYFKGREVDMFNAVESTIINQSKNDFELYMGLKQYYYVRSWYLLFSFKYKDAQASAQKILKTDSINMWANANLAHSLLLQGKFNDALKVYSILKFTMVDGVMGGDFCLKNLDELEIHGIKNKDFEKIRKFLKK